MTLGHHFSTFQMEHYKLDWHRFNLRQKMAGLPPVTVEEFERKTGAGEENPHTFSTEFNRWKK